VNWRALVPALKNVPFLWLLGLTGAGFILSSGAAAPVSLSALCGQFSLAGVAGGAAIAIGLWSPTVLAAAWLVMIVAMMPPLLAQPVDHILRSSPRHRRRRSLFLFSLSYAAMWCAAGLLLVPAAIVLRLVLPGLWAPLAATLLALAWSASPLAQAARNRCHRVRRIGAFGAAADRDCLRYGLSTGIACTTVCWPWMLVPIAFDAGHLPAMVLVTVLLFADRTAPPAKACWRVPPAFPVLAVLGRRQKVVGRR